MTGGDGIKGGGGAGCESGNRKPNDH